MDFIVGLPCKKCEGQGEIFLGGLGIYKECDKCKGTGTRKVIKATKRRPERK